MDKQKCPSLTLTDLAVERDAAQTLAARREPPLRGRDALRLVRHDHRPLEQIGVLSVDHGTKRPADAPCPHPARTEMANQALGGLRIVCAAYETALCGPPVHKQPSEP